MRDTGTKGICRICMIQLRLQFESFCMEASIWSSTFVFKKSSENGRESLSAHSSTTGA